jgi:hypothetical protein
MAHSAVVAAALTQQAAFIRANRNLFPTGTGCPLQLGAMSYLRCPLTATSKRSPTREMNSAGQLSPFVIPSRFPLPDYRTESSNLSRGTAPDLF